MSELPQVSVVVPAYNAAQYVGEAVESLLAQDYPNLEIIVVDDGSKDDTRNVVARFGDKVRLHSQANAGQSAAMTKGWSMAGGTFLGYLSADDKLLPAAVRRCAEALVARPDVVLAYPDFDIIDKCSVRRSTVHPPDFSRRALFADLHCLPGPGALFRRSAYETAGPWNSALRQIPDLEFFLRLALNGDFFHVPEVLAQFRIHEESTTYRPVPFAQAEEPMRVIDEFFARPALPEEIMRWKSRGRANAYLLSAAIHGRSGRPVTAIRRMLQAAAECPHAMWSRKAAGHIRLIARHAFARATAART